MEVEIYAPGLNSKDVAVTLGSVTENEYLLAIGLECTDIVRCVSKGADRFTMGTVLLYSKTAPSQTKSSFQ